MNTITVSVRLIAVAAAVAALSVSTAAFANGATSQEAPVAQAAVVAAHQGPGVGSVKTPPFNWISGAPQTATAPLAYHVSDSASAPQQHMGPGLGSVKSPAVSQR